MKRWELSPPQPLQAMRLAAATDYVVALAIWVVAQVVPPAVIRAVRFTGRSSGGARTRIGSGPPVGLREQGW